MSEPKGLRVLVCGGRDYSDRDFMDRYLRMFDRRKGPIKLIISGEARGADTLAKQWAIGCGCPYLGFPANWKVFGRDAGPTRNQQMLDEGKPDWVIAFKGGRGTADMVARAEKAGLPVWKVGERDFSKVHEFLNRVAEEVAP